MPGGWVPVQDEAWFDSNWLPFAGGRETRSFMNISRVPAFDVRGPGAGAAVAQWCAMWPHRRWPTRVAVTTSAAAAVDGLSGAGGGVEVGDARRVAHELLA